MILFQQLQCSFDSLEWGDFAKRWWSSPMITLRGRQNSFKQLTEFTMLNTLLDPLASNINDSLTRPTVLLPFTWMGRFSKKVMFSPMRTLRGRHYSIKQQSQFTMLKKVLNTLVSIINDSLTRATVLLPFTWKGPFCKKLMFLTDENTES
jgi:hypothetical protein